MESRSNSDLVIEHTMTDNLRWSIERFSTLENSRATFATKFAHIDSLLDLDHRGRTQIRFSINPPQLVRKVEIGTSPLDQLLQAANRMFHAGYRVGLNLAPIMLVDDWREQYDQLLTLLPQHLDPDLLCSTFFELIFMTYGWANDRVNQASMPGILDLFERDKMRPKGPTKMHYKPPLREVAADWFRREITTRFPSAVISYIV